MPEVDSEIEHVIEISENVEIGEIISDQDTPSFEKFRFKAFHDKYMSPGSVAVKTIKTIPCRKSGSIS